MPLPYGSSPASYDSVAAAVAVEATRAEAAEAGAALLGSSNIFTAIPQVIGTTPSTGQTELQAGHVFLFAEGAAPPAVSPPFVKLYGYCGGASGNNGWDIGIDTANHGGGQDFYIGRVTNGTTDDCFFLNWSSGCIGMGAAIPPPDNWAVTIEAKTSTTGTLALIQSGGSTANLFQISSSGGTPEFWVDPSFHFNTPLGLLLNG